MSLRGTPLRSRSRLACLTLVVGLAGGLIAPAAAASTSTPTPTATAVATATATPEATSTPTTTVTPTATPTAVPTATPTAVPTTTPTAVPTSTPTAVPTSTASPTSSPEPSATATPLPGIDPICDVPSGGPVAEEVMGEVTATLSGAAVTVTIPPIRTTSCWERAELRVWNLDYERPTDLGYSLELLTTIPIEGRDFRGVSLGLGDLPAGDQDILVAIYGFDGDVQGSTRETIGEQIHLDVPDVSAEQYAADAAAYDACLAPNDGRIVKSKSGDVTASTTNGVMTVVLPSVETVDCLDSITFVIWAADYDRPTEDHPFVAVKLDEIVLDSSSYAGGTYSYPVAPGHVDAMVTIVGTLGVLEGGLEYLQYRAHVPQPGEGTTTTVSTTGGTTRGGSTLAETGVETAGLVSGAAALLALGLVSLVATRRRRSAQQS